MNYYKERFWDDGDMVLVEGDDGEWCRRDDVDAALAALRAELAAMTARAKQAERELRLLADVLTKHETGGPA